MGNYLKNLHAFEKATILAITTTAAISLLTWVPILPLRPWSVFHFFRWAKFFLVSSAVIATVYLVMLIAVQRELKKPLWAVKEKFLDPSTLLLAFKFLICLEITFTIYSTTKQYIPFINPNRYDEVLNHADTVIHFGINPALFMKDSIITRLFAQEMDYLYRAWFFIKPFILSFIIFFRPPRERDVLLATFLLLWGTGAMIGLVWPSSGPFVLYPEQGFPPLKMWSALTAQVFLNEIFLAGRPPSLWGDGNLIFGTGLMALPSLHVTVCLYYVYAFRQSNRLVLSLALSFLFIIFLTSMASGWHYAIDGYVGLPIVAISVYLAQKFTPRVSKGIKMESAPISKHHA